MARGSRVAFQLPSKNGISTVFTCYHSITVMPALLDSARRSLLINSLLEIPTINSKIPHD